MTRRELLEAVKQRAKRAVNSTKATKGERTTICPDPEKCTFPACLC